LKEENTLIIGIDQSLTLTGICITHPQSQTIYFEHIQTDSNVVKNAKLNNINIANLQVAKEGLIDNKGKIKVPVKERDKAFKERMKLSQVERIDLIADQFEKIVFRAMLRVAPDQIVFNFEAVSYGSVGQIASLALLLGHLRHIARNHGQVLLVEPSALKKAATGKGNAKKEQMIDCLPEEIRKQIESHAELHGLKKIDDLADSYHLSQFQSSF